MMFRGKHVSSLDRITGHPVRSFMVLASLSGTRNSGSIPSSRKAFYFVQIVQNIVGGPSRLLFNVYGRFLRCYEATGTEHDSSPTSGADTKNV